jgi:hypothetical protein
MRATSLSFAHTTLLAIATCTLQACTVVVLPPNTARSTSAAPTAATAVKTTSAPLPATRGFATTAYSPPLAGTPMNKIVQDELFPQLEYFFDKLNTEKELVTVDGYPAFKGNDKFLPGKIALGLGYVVLNTAPSAPNFKARLNQYRDIADLTINIDNDTWGMYYYLSTLYKLKNAGLLDQAFTPATLVALKQKLDWRKFVNTTDYTLINLPSNYYGVAFSIARLRMLMGWEDESGSITLLDKTLRHYEKYSGKFGFSDETDGEGRFDRYSILLIAEICQRFVETGLPVTLELKALLRKAAAVTLNIGNTAGDGFSFGRSIGPYGDTSVLEILSVAAYLDVLTPEEKQYAYVFSSLIAAKYVDFWYDPATKSVDLWAKGRRTDAYRGKHRILGENFSLLHQLIYTNAIWNKAGFKDITPKADFKEWLAKTQPTFSFTRFAQGEYDRALAIVRDNQKVFSLLMINGGSTQHANSPYYPLPHANLMIAGIADSGYANPQLLPKFTLADGTSLIGTAFIKNIQSAQTGDVVKVTYQQDALTQLGKNSPIKDSRLSLETQYTFAPGVITRTDKYTPAGALDVKEIALNFASFSADATTNGTTTNFQQGDVYAFEVSGLSGCSSNKTQADDGYKSNSGAMKTHVYCSTAAFKMAQPLVIQWVMKYR